MRAHATLALVVAALALALAAGTAAAADQVHLRGTAYEFNNTDTRLAGAVIRVVERPRLRAVTRANGTYDLAVPDRATVTPYISAPGYHSVHLQTFRTRGEDLRRVNFQTPTETVYRALAALLDVPLDPDGELSACAIVSTFSTRNVRAVPFRQFTGYGAHGVAGATAFTSPALPGPIYFNDQVLPDRSQARSSIDGGVIWTEVPRGVYRVRARHPSTRFASFLATCAPGRVVNANPPWGLHQLGRQMRATVSARWTPHADGARLRRLRVARLPTGAVVRVRCRGSGCPFGARALRARERSRLDLLAALGRAGREWRRGQRLEVAVTAHAHDGKIVRWRVRATGAPAPATLCVPLGYTRPRPSCRPVSG
jgi:hypothetical protein